MIKRLIIKRSLKKGCREINKVNLVITSLKRDIKFIPSDSELKLIAYVNDIIAEVFKVINHNYRCLLQRRRRLNFVKVNLKDLK